MALADRSQRLLVQHIDSLREAFRWCQGRHPLYLTQWLFCRSTCTVSGRYQLATPIIPTVGAVKAAFSRSLPDCNFRSPSKILKGERGIWQRRYWEHTLRNQDDWRRHMDYIHYNPVKHQHVAKVADWPYSTFHRYVEVGTYPRDWAGSGQPSSGGFGEV